MSKALATILTQPLIVAKVGLQSRPPPARKGKPFSSFIEVMRFIIEHEGVLGLFKGMGPQILKGLLVQGILMMTKEKYVYPVMRVSAKYYFTSEYSANFFSNRVELLMVLFLRYLKSLSLSRARGAIAASSAATLAKNATLITPLVKS